MICVDVFGWFCLGSLGFSLGLREGSDPVKGEREGDKERKRNNNNSQRQRQQQHQQQHQGQPEQDRQTAKPKDKTPAQKKPNQQPPPKKNVSFAEQSAVVKASSTLNPNICDKNLLSLQKITL
jgi:hypothetical protein